MATKGVHLDMRPLTQFLGTLKLRAGAFRRVFKQWGARYRGFARMRFISLSAGGGEWPRLAKSTLAARRRKTKGGKLRTKAGKRRRFRSGAHSMIAMAPRILRDTGMLLAVLQPQFTSKPGQYQRDLPDGIRVGYGGPHRHSRKEEGWRKLNLGGGTSIADIASFHQEGGGRLPKRQIIVKPNSSTMADMVSDLRRAAEYEGR